MREPRDWEQWPTCRQCATRRLTVCPGCGTAGSRFLLAEYLAGGEPLRSRRHSDDRSEIPRPDVPIGPRREEAGSPEEASEQYVRLVCPQCDEVFVPEFYRICAACGKDEGSGREPPALPPRAVTRRAVIAVTTLLAVGLALLAYFWFLFREPA